MSRKSELIAKHSEISLVISDELSATGIRNLLRPEATSSAVLAVAMRLMLTRYAVKKRSVRGSLSIVHRSAALSVFCFFFVFWSLS